MPRSSPPFKKKSPFAKQRAGGPPSAKPPLGKAIMRKPPAQGAQAAADVESPDDETEASPSQGERLQKVLAAAGLGSRRQCEELITDVRVEVARKVVSHLGTRVNAHAVEIRVDGVALPRPKLVHYMLNKPTGVVSTNRDPAGRTRVIDLLPTRDLRLFTVGRLDMSSEGLILVTNDGELANRLTHPRYGIDKTYNVEVAGVLEQEELQTLRKGVYLAEGFARVVNVKIKATYKKSTLLEIVLNEGKNREIRRLLARVGHKVERLKRIALGPLRLGELASGEFRPLTREELKSLRLASEPAEGKKPFRKRRGARPGMGGGKKPPGGMRPKASSDAKTSPGPRRPTVIGAVEPRRPAVDRRPAKKRPMVGKSRPKPGKGRR
jgi:23S rRNA pseudouridine2605 synthase